MPALTLAEVRAQYQTDHPLHQLSSMVTQFAERSGIDALWVAEPEAYGSGKIRMASLLLSDAPPDLDVRFCNFSVGIAERFGWRILALVKVEDPHRPRWSIIWDTALRT